MSGCKDCGGGGILFDVPALYQTDHELVAMTPVWLCKDCFAARLMKTDESPASPGYQG